MKKLLLFLGLAFLATGRLAAVDPEPYTLGVSFSFRISGVGNGIMTVYDATGPSVGHTTYNATTESPMGTAWLKPGRLYLAHFGASGPYEYWLSFTAPDGYQLYIDGAPSDLTYRYTGGAEYGYDYYLELRPINGTNQAAAGAFSGIEVGKSVSWAVGLGGIRNGNGAGVIYFKEFDLTNAPANRQRLYYVPPANYGQITVVTDGGSAQILRQIKTPQTLVDLVDLNGGDPNAGYTFKYYDPSQGTWNGTTYTVSGSPWRTIKVETPLAGQLKITETEGTVSRISQLSLSGGPVGINDYTWTLQEGSSSAWVRTTTYASTNYPSASPKPYRDLLVKVFKGNSTADSDLATKSKYRYESPGNWGEEVVIKYAYPLNTTADVDALKTVYDYYTDDTARGNFRRLKSVTDTTKNWVGYIYYDQWEYRGTVLYEFHPQESTPATVTFNGLLGRVRAFSYQPDWTGRYRIPYGSYEYRQGLLCGQSVNVPSINQSTLGQYYTRHQTDAYANASTYERSYSEVMDVRSDNNPDYQGLIWSVKRPDLSQDSYAHYQGTYNPSTKAFTYGWADPMYFRTIVWRGSSDSSVGTQFTGYDGISITPVYLIANKSTMDVTIRNPAGLVLRTETHVYTGGSSFSLMKSEDFVYAGSGRLTESYANGRAMTNNTYTNGLLASTVDPSGIVTQFVYDGISRVSRQAKIGSGDLKIGGITHLPQATIYTHFEYDGASRVRKTIVSSASTKPVTPGNLDLVTTTDYYLTGQLKEQVQFSGSSTSLTTGYLYTSDGRVVTTNLPGGATKVTEVHLDGSPMSVTGTGVVHEYATYSLNSSPVQRVQVIRPVSSTYGATTTTTFDWLGRPLTIVRPAWSSGTMTQTNYYNDRGQLWKVTRPGVAATLYTYDTLGGLYREALDVYSNDLIDLNGMGSSDPTVNDRITEHLWEFIPASGWWRQEITKVYAQAGVNAGTQTARVERKISDLGTNVASIVKTYDNFTNATTQTVVIDRANKVVTITTDVPDSSMDLRQIVHNGLAVESRDQAGNRSRVTYDVIGRQFKAIDPRTAGTMSFGTITRYQAKSSLVEKITNVAGDDEATYTYDSAGRVTTVTDVRSRVARYDYNLRSQKVHEWGQTAYPVEYNYDELGRVFLQKTYRGATNLNATTWASVAAGLADRTLWVYDENTGLLKEKYDEANLDPDHDVPLAGAKKVSYTYTSAGQLYERTWARNVTTTYGYSSTTGELLTVDYPDTNDDLTYTYNRLGQIATVANVEMGTRTFNYALSGTLELQNEALPAYFNARYVSYPRAATGVIGRPTGLQLGSSGTPTADQAITYDYDTYGRFNTLSAASQTFTYGYTSNSNLIATVSNTGLYYTDTRVYDPRYNRTDQRRTSWGVLPVSKAKFDYQQDAMSRVLRVIKTGELFDRYGTATPYGITTNYTYDDYSQLKSETTVDMAGSPGAIAGRQDTNYDYDTIGNRTGVTHNGNTATYTPNKLNQYTQRTVPGYFDVAGAAPGATVTVTKHVGGGPQTASRNGLYFFNAYPLTNTSDAVYEQLDITDDSTPPQTGDVKAYVPETPEIFDYDDDGNLEGDGRWLYDYDAENRLITMETDSTKVPSGLTRQKLTFKYDYLGRRVSKEVQNWNGSGYNNAHVSLRFVYNGWNLMAELDHLASEAVVRSYYWGLDLSNSLQGAGGVGGLVFAQGAFYNSETGSTDTGKTLVAVYDAGGNLHAMLNTSTVNGADSSTYNAGSLVAAYEYDAFGKILRESGPYAAANPFRFSTKYTDIESGLVYHETRYYLSSLGRFITRDSISEQGGLNLYAYVSNRVPNAWDYLGMVNILSHDLFDPDDPGYNSSVTGIRSMQDAFDRMVDNYSMTSAFAASVAEFYRRELQANLDAAVNALKDQVASGQLSEGDALDAIDKIAAATGATVVNSTPSTPQVGQQRLVDASAGYHNPHLGMPGQADAAQLALAGFVDASSNTFSPFSWMTGVPNPFSKDLEKKLEAFKSVVLDPSIGASSPTLAEAANNLMRQGLIILGQSNSAGWFGLTRIQTQTYTETSHFFGLWTTRDWIDDDSILTLVTNPTPGFGGVFPGKESATVAAVDALQDQLRDLGYIR